MIKKFYNSYFAYFLMYNFYFLSYALFSSLISIYMLGLGFFRFFFCVHVDSTSHWSVK